MSLHLHHEHHWDLSPHEASQLQLELRGYVRIEPYSDDDLRLVGGVDASFSKDTILAAVVVLDYPTMQPDEQATVELPLTFPYIPGLLSFREAPAVLAALGKLSGLPDVLLIDGHGLAHPRRFGLACHVGVLLDLPTIGCAKSVLMGKCFTLGDTAGSAAELIADGQVVGMAVRTRDNVKPIYVSVGHRVDLPCAVRIVLACAMGYRLPEPIRQAHLLAGQERQ